MSWYGLSHLLDASLPPSHPVIYRGGKTALTFGDLQGQTARVRAWIKEHPARSWGLFSDDYGYFAIAFLALLSEGIEPYVLSSLRGAEDIGKVLDTQTITHILSETNPEGLSVSKLSPSSTFFLQTSGSTAKAKWIRHTLFELEEGAREGMEVWNEKLVRDSWAASVPPYHVFGLLSVLIRALGSAVPLQAQRVTSPDALASLSSHPLTFVTSPTFLDACVRDPSWQDGVSFKGLAVLCSGGRLEDTTAKRFAKLTGCTPIEIYGSTETGSIAWRQGQSPWTPFPRVRWQAEDDGTLVVRSPMVGGGAPYETSDLVRPVDATHFLLLGRKDSVIKIGEQRIDLTDIEFQIRQLGIVDEVACIPLRHRYRMEIGAVLVLNEQGKTLLGSMTPSRRVLWLRRALSQSLDPVFLPRRWQFTGEIPHNTMGKRNMVALQALFDEGVEIHSLETTDDGLVAVLSVCEESPYYNVHFEGFKLLPAVAQIDIVTRMIRRSLSPDFIPTSIPKTKFSKPIRPNMEVKLSITKVGDVYNFSFQDMDGKICAKGRLGRG